MNIFYYFLLFIFYSVLGWLMEIVFCSITEKKLVNRGFLLGPYCPIYGFGVMLILFLVDRYKSDLAILFVMSIFLCSVLEYFTSLFMEKVFGARWWDYSDKKFNLNGRICLETMLPFGILGCVMVYFVNPFISNLILGMNIEFITILGIIIFVIFIVDSIISFAAMFNVKKIINKFNKDSTEEITKAVKSFISEKKLIFSKRIVRAFPNLKIKIQKLKNIQK